LAVALAITGTFFECRAAAAVDVVAVAWVALGRLVAQIGLLVGHSW
jgi:hypothetical protein